VVACVCGGGGVKGGGLGGGGGGEGSEPHYRPGPTPLRAVTVRVCVCRKSGRGREGQGGGEGWEGEKGGTHRAYKNWYNDAVCGYIQQGFAVPCAGQYASIAAWLWFDLTTDLVDQHLYVLSG
jgi:hypothetical protein